MSADRLLTISEYRPLFNKICTWICAENETERSCSFGPGSGPGPGPGPGPGGPVSFRG